MNDENLTTTLPIRVLLSPTTGMTQSSEEASSSSTPNEGTPDRSVEINATSKSKENGPEASGSTTSDGSDSTQAEEAGKTCSAVLAATRKHARPLQLLDLPVDILKEIVKEISIAHASDLTALALTHSALHRLAIPHIYSRFDIVWPDLTLSSDTRSGVDALTYGLATLVMSSCMFDQSSPDKIRRGNYYADYTKKFSLGNGPSDWVQEYMVMRESGKMLGTLVAIAIARMRNLESFIWDMPTGILRDVWSSLSSLGDRPDGEQTRLEKLWIRWHRNSLIEGNYDLPQSPPHSPHTFPQPASTRLDVNGNPMNDQHTPHINKVERPTFSCISPLKSLSVLDIDELEYLDEMAVLITKSRELLQELRVGVSFDAMGCEWIAAYEGGDLQQTRSLTSGKRGVSNWDRRLGGVFGVLFSGIYNIREHQRAISGEPEKQAPTINAELMKETPSEGVQDAPVKGDTHPLVPIAQLPSEAKPISDARHDVVDASVEPKTPLQKPSTDKQIFDSKLPAVSSFEPMHLKTLEVERVHLSVTVLTGALDWTRLTDLTVLDCPGHEDLWKALRRKFSPTPDSLSASPSKRPPPSDYHINLRKLHTNTVSPALIAFLRETLAPHSLEVLFLQQSPFYYCKVSIETIFNGPLKRHRRSLTKLSLDSRDRDKNDDRSLHTGWRRWLLSHDILEFITSGRMPKLRELGMAIDLKDWHFFLQRLPIVPHIRSLYIPFIAKENGSTSYVGSEDAKELALQIIDIVTLCPTVQLCYLGIAEKCYEIVEYNPSTTISQSANSGSNDRVADDDVDPDDEDGDDEDEDADEDNDDDEEGTNDDQDPSDDDPIDDDDDSIFEDAAKTATKLKLREILFYDDKIAVFKARHGRL